MSNEAKWLVLLAAVRFGFTSTSALGLRYFSSDLIASQLRTVRLRIRGGADDLRHAQREEGPTKPPFEIDTSIAAIFLGGSHSRCRHLHRVSLRCASPVESIRRLYALC